MGRKESIRSEPEEESVPEPEPEPITYGKGSFSFVDSSVYGRYERPSRTTAVGAHYGYRACFCRWGLPVRPGRPPAARAGYACQRPREVRRRVGSGQHGRRGVVPLCVAGDIRGKMSDCRAKRSALSRAAAQPLCSTLLCRAGRVQEQQVPRLWRLPVG